MDWCMFTFLEVPEIGMEKRVMVANFFKKYVGTGEKASFLYDLHFCMHWNIRKTRVYA